ncbi:UDP diphosphate synthase [Halobacteriales archaeon QS_4_62_28]|nr:MAG: UDP diphosphate synthase [Halobacteriales archaeon QS_4_62_28]
MALYDRYLAARLQWSDADLPETVALVITERDLLEKGAYATLERFFDLALQFGAEQIIVYVSVLDERVVPSIERELDRLRAPRDIAVRVPEDDQPADAPVVVSIGLGGKHEFGIAARSIAESVDSGDLTPEDIDESVVEQELVFPTAPDLVIKTGAERLSDFMIWQSVYSELYFTDVNWQNFRERDYLRALRDYQDRQRRFGR